MNDEKKENPEEEQKPEDDAIIKDPDEFEDISQSGPTGQQSSFAITLTNLRATDRTISVTVTSPYNATLSQAFTAARTFFLFNAAGVNQSPISSVSTAVSPLSAGFPITVTFTFTSTIPTDNYFIQLSPNRYTATVNGRTIWNSFVRSGMIAGPGAAPPVVATAAWSNMSFTSGKLQGTITFNSAITRMSSSDFQVINASNQVQSWTFDSVSSSASANSGVIIRARAPNNLNGTFRLRLRARSVRGARATSDNSPASNVTSPSVTVDTRPAIRASATWSNVSYTGGKLTGTMTFNQNVTDISSSDFEVVNSSGTAQTGWTFDSPSTTASANTGITISATPPSNTNASFSLRIKANSVRGPRATSGNSPSAVVTSSAVAIDNRPAEIAVATWSNVSYTGGKLQATLTFDKAITGLSSADLRVRDASFAQTGWTFDSVPATAAANTGITIRATPPANRNSSYRFRLVANSVLGPRATTGNSPAAHSDSSLVAVDNRPAEVATAAWSSVSFTGGKLTGTLTFNAAVTGISASDFDILNVSDATQTGWTFDTPSATASANTGITISATPPSNINGSFKIRLKATSVLGPRATTANSPSSAVTTTGVAIDNRTAVSITHFRPKLTTTAAQQATTREFELDLDRDVDATQLTTADFSTSNSSDATIASVSPSTGTEDVYTITVNQLVNRNGSYTVRLRQNAIPSKDNAYLQGPTAIATSTSASFDRRSAVVVSHFRPKLTTTAAQQAATREFELDFDRDIDATALGSGDFTISDNDVTFGSISPTSGTEDTYTVTVNQPVDKNGSYTISLAQNAVSAKTNAYLRGPAAAYTSTSASFDRRSAVGVTSFGPKLTTTAAQAAATREFELDLDTDIDLDADALVAADFSSSLSTVTIASVSPSTGTEDVLTVTVNQPDDSHGSYTISLAANSINAKNDAYLRGPTSIYTSTSASFDTRDNVTVTDTLPSTEQTGATVTGTITFSESVPVIDSDDFTLTNGATIAITETTGPRTTYNFTITQPTNYDGNYTVTLKATAIDATNTYKGLSAAYLLGTVNCDTRRAITASWTEPTGTQIGGTSDVTLVLGQSVPSSQLDSSDFTVTGATYDSISPTSGSQTTYTVTVDHPDNQQGSYTIALNADRIADGTTYLEGPDNAVTSSSISYDSRERVSVSSHVLPSITQTGATTSGSITFDRAIPAQLIVSDFTVTGGASIAISPTTGNQATYNLTLTNPSGNGSYTVTLKANTIAGTSQYQGGPSAAYSLGTVTYDRRTAVAVSSFALKSPTTTSVSTATREFELDFNQDIDATALTSGDFTVTGGGATFSGITPTSGDEDTYTVTVNQPNNARGSYTITLDADAVPTKDQEYLEGPASDFTTTSTSFDRRSAVTVTSHTLPTGTQTGSSITGSITFSRAVPVIDSNDFTITGGARIAVTETTGTQATYNFTITQPTTSEGSYTVSLKSTAVTDTDTYTGLSSSYSLGTVAYDTRIATTASWDTVTGIQRGATVQLTLRFNHAIPVGQISISKFTLPSGVSIPSQGGITQPQGGVFIITINQPTTGNGSYTISLNANAIGMGATYLEGPTAAVPVTINYDRRTQVAVSSFTAPTGTQTGATAQLILTLDRNIPASEFSGADFRTPAGVDFRSITPTDGSHSTYTVTVDQPDTGSGSYIVTLEANSIAGNGYTSGPAMDVDSTRVQYDRRPELNVSLFGLKSPSTTSSSTATREFTLDFNRDVDPEQLRSDDFSVIGSGNATFGSSSPTTGSDEDEYTIIVNQPDNSHGTYLVRLLADAIPGTTAYQPGPEDPFDTAQVSFDRRSAVAISTFEMDPSNHPEDPHITFNLVFDRAVPADQLSRGDFAVTNNASIRTINPDSGNQASYTVEVNQPEGSGTYTVRLNAGAIPSSNTYLASVASSVVTVTHTNVPTPDFRATWDPNGVADPDIVPEADRSVSVELEINEDVTGEVQSSHFEVWDNNDDPASGWTITATQPASPIKVTAVPDPNVMAGTYKLVLTANAFGPMRPARATASPPIIIPAPAMSGTIIPTAGKPASGFREAILKRVEEQLCKLLIDNPRESYQNDITGYTNLYRLKYTGINQVVQLDSPSRNLPVNPTMVSDADKVNAFLSPRIPNAGYSTPLRRIFCRPIQNFDVTGLREGGTSSGRAADPDRVVCRADHPAVFLHIIDAEKDIYWPDRKQKAKAQVDAQVEYMKIAVDCVFRNEAIPDPATDTRGNGKDWNDRVSECLPIADLPLITLQPPMGMTTPSGSYQPVYHRTINQKAVQFVEDAELLLNPNSLVDTYRFGPADATFPNGVYAATVYNTNLALWGMLPEAENSPTDTVRCVFEVEIHYPKEYGPKARHATI